MFRVPDRIHSQIKTHALQCRDDREICGLIGIRGGVAVAYVRARNSTKVPYKFRLTWRDKQKALARLPADCEPVLLHSHPSGAPVPSKADLQSASSGWLGRPYAIYSRNLNLLRFHELAPDRSGHRPFGDSTGNWIPPR